MDEYPLLEAPHCNKNHNHMESMYVRRLVVSKSSLCLLDFNSKKHLCLIVLFTSFQVLSTSVYAAFSLTVYTNV